ncbi:MAG: hypothetical protein AABX33_04380 [Nanoarchaeota archaeon]|mgnify:CR=1 FL=1
MNNTNSVNLFGLEKVTEEEFQSWKHYFAKVGLTLGSEDKDNLCLQSFMMNFRGDPSYPQVAYYFNKSPHDMRFDDYLEFLSKLLYTQGENIVGNLGNLVFDEQDIDQRKKERRDIVVRQSWDWKDIFYFKIKPYEETTEVDYIDLGREKMRSLRRKMGIRDPMTIFEEGQNLFLRHKTISFVGHFANLQIPFMNVEGFNFLIEEHLPIDGVGKQTLHYKGVRYSMKGAEDFFVPKDNFRV